MQQSFYIRTYGCQMNERDSEALACLLESRGFTAADREEDADIILFNTCSVRAQAEHKVLGKLGLLKKRKRRQADLVIGVMGCMAQNRGREITDRFPYVDFVLGTEQLHVLPEVLHEALEGRHGMVFTERGNADLSRLGGHTPGNVVANVAVMRGCNQFCSYCIVPYVRGREQSRPIDEIVTEVQRLVDDGTREILLLGQNITAYGLAEARRAGTYTPDISPFADLLAAVNNVTGLSRIRFTSPHPKYMNRAFVDAITQLPKVCEALHIPLQSGSNRILQAMRRGYTVEEYLARIEALRSRCPEVTFSTDIIVGFPGETESEFEETRRIMEQVGYDMAYIFRYSTRTGTAAADMHDDVTDEEKHRRNQILLDDLEKRVKRRNPRYLDSIQEVLVEGPSKRNQARWSGRTRTNKVCIFEPDKPAEAGQLRNVRVTRVTAHSLFGKLEPAHNTR